MVRPAQFKIEQESGSDGTCTLAISGELDLATAPRLEQEVNTAVAEGAKVVVVDLTNLSFIDSTGLRVFLRLNEQAAAAGWRLTMVRPSEQVKTILRVTGAQGELPIQPRRSAS
jgi:anti-sigma B factor antagonist